MTTPSTFKLGYPPLKYSTVPFAGAFTRDPTTADVNNPNVGGPYRYGTMWVNSTTNGVWIFTGIVANAAQWLGITDPASGNVDGPASATDNALARFDGTTGKLIQNSVGILTDAGILTGIRPTLPAGTAVAGTAPMKFTLGVNLTAPEAGAVEYDGTSLFYTNNAAARQTLLHAPTLTSSVDNTLPRFDGTSWGIQDSGVVVSDTDVMSAFTAILKAGTATAGTAPLKFTLGVNLTAPEAGAVEYDGTHLFYTNNSAARQTVGVGPTSSTDNRLARMDGTAGAYQEATAATLSDTDVLTFPANGGVILTAGTRKGTATLVGGTVNVPTAAAITGSVICLSIVALGTVTDPMPMLITINNGVSFDITSEDATDTSTINWAIVG